MTTPNRVRACADALAAAAGSISERIDSVDVRGTPDAGLRAELAEAAAEWVDGGFGTFAALNAFGETLAIDDLPGREGELRVTFGKKPTTSTFYFLTARGVAGLLENQDRAADARHVLVAETFEPFRTAQCDFESWTAMVADAKVSEDLALPVPRRIVRDQVAVVPLSIGPLLLTKSPQRSEEVSTEEPASGEEGNPDIVDNAQPERGVARPSDVFTIWRDAALPQLLLSLADEVWQQDGELRVALTGPRKRKLPAAIDKVDAERDFKIVNEVADWVYNSGRDAETRHTLFVHELAREWPGEDAFSTTFSARAPGALEAAKTAFRMHVREASKETLKSLQELRKTLTDDVTRVVTQTRELTANLWRDLLVVVGAVLGRFTLLATPDAGEAVFADALLYGLVVYLVFSLGMVIYANSRFMALFRKAQGSWQTKLYGFVDPQDFQSLATTPLKEAETVYIRTRRAAVTAYALTIIALVMLAILTPAPPRTASTNPDPQAYAIDAANDSTEANPLDLDNPRASEPEHDNPVTVNATTAHPAPTSSAVPDADAARPAA